MIEGDVKDSKSCYTGKYSFDYRKFGSGGMNPFSYNKEKLRVTSFDVEDYQPNKPINIVEFVYDNQDTQATAVLKGDVEELIKVSITDQVSFLWFFIRRVFEF